MEITSHATSRGVEVVIRGRLDGYWADHLERTLAEIVRQGNHRLRLDLSQVAYLSSAGIRVLVKFYNQLKKIHGSLVLANPSEPVRMVLEITGLAPMLVEADAAEARPAAAAQEVRRLALAEAAFEVYELQAGAVLECRVVGSDEPLGSAGFRADHCTNLACADSMFALGIGAFGESFEDSSTRFGEFLAVGGAAAYMPADGTNVPDYLVASGALPAEIKVLYGLACEGRFRHLARFDATERPGGAIGLADLSRACVDLAGGRAAGVVLVAEAAGLVGAALRRSPARSEARPRTTDIFAHPDVREWLTFTSEGAFARSLVLGVGVVASSPADPLRRQLRPLGGSDGLLGHFHAAAFSFRPYKKGVLDLKETVEGLFETEALLGVLHLLNDDRGAAGVGESDFVRGACWIGGIAD